MLLLSPSCPRPVLCLCSPGILELLDRKGQIISNAFMFDVTAVRQVVQRALGFGLNGEGLFSGHDVSIFVV
jgi:mediator of RNA polymerase II transcription subunit 5